MQLTHLNLNSDLFLRYERNCFLKPGMGYIVWFPTQVNPQQLPCFLGADNHRHSLCMCMHTKLLLSFVCLLMMDLDLAHDVFLQVVKQTKNPGAFVTFTSEKQVIASSSQ